jgi:hypothetical protein
LSKVNIRPKWKKIAQSGHPVAVALPVFSAFEFLNHRPHWSIRTEVAQPFSSSHFKKL